MASVRYYPKEESERKQYELFSKVYDFLAKYGFGDHGGVLQNSKHESVKIIWSGNCVKVVFDVSNTNLEGLLNKLEAEIKDYVAKIEKDIPII